MVAERFAPPNMANVVIAISIFRPIHSWCTCKTFSAADKYVIAETFILVVNLKTLLLP